MVFEKLEQTLYSIKIFPRQEMNKVTSPVDTGRKLNVHKTFRRRPGRLLNVLCTFNLRPVSTGRTKYGPNMDQIL